MQVLCNTVMADLDVLREFAVSCPAMFRKAMWDDVPKQPAKHGKAKLLVEAIRKTLGPGSISASSWSNFKQVAAAADDLFHRPWCWESEGPVQGVYTVLLALTAHHLRMLRPHAFVSNVVDTHSACSLLVTPRCPRPDGSFLVGTQKQLVGCYSGGTELKPNDNNKTWEDHEDIFQWEVEALAQMFECTPTFLDVSGHFGTLDVVSDGMSIRLMRNVVSHVTGELLVTVSDRMQLLPDNLSAQSSVTAGFDMLVRRLCADPVKIGVRNISSSLAGHLIAAAAVVQTTPGGSAEAVAAETAAKEMAVALAKAEGPVDLASVVQVAAAAAAAAATSAAVAQHVAAAAAAATASASVAQPAASADVLPTQQPTDLVDAATAGARAAMSGAAEQWRQPPMSIVAQRRSKVFKLAGRFKAKFLQPGELESERAVLRFPWHLAEKMLDGQRLAPRLLYEHPTGILVMPLSQHTLWQALIQRTRVTGSFATLGRVVRAVTTALSVMHQHRWLHCDVTLHNILVDFDDRRQLLRVLLNDFGLSVQMDGGCDGHRLATERGHPGFRSTTVSAGHRYGTGDDLEAFHWTMVALAADRVGGFSRPERLDLLERPLSLEGLNDRVDEDVVGALQEVHEAVRRRQQRPLTYAAFTGAFSRTQAERQRLQAARDAFVANLPEYFATSRDPTTVAADAARGWLPSDVLQAWNGLAPDVQQFFLNS